MLQPRADDGHAGARDLYCQAARPQAYRPGGQSARQSGIRPSPAQYETLAFFYISVSLRWFVIGCADGWAARCLGGRDCGTQLCNRRVAKFEYFERCVVGLCYMMIVSFLCFVFSGSFSLEAHNSEPCPPTRHVRSDLPR